MRPSGGKRETFVAAYATLRREAQASGATIFFVDEAHFYADVDLHAKWVLKGAPALVASTSPRYGEKASYYSAGRCHINVYWDRCSRPTPHVELVFALFPATGHACQARNEALFPTSRASLTLM